MKRSLVSITLALTMGAVACTSDDPAATPTLPTEDLNSEDILLTSGLETVGDCDALLERLVAEGLERVGPYGFGQHDFRFGPVAMEDDAMEEAADGGAMSDSAAPTTTARAAQDEGGGDSSSSDGVSGTNNQESGVDEADIVKTDGNRMVVVSNGKLQVIDITGDTPRLVHTVKLSEFGGSGELFMNGDQALLMQQSWDEGGPWGGIARSSMPRHGMQITRITTVDLAAGTVGDSIEFEGNYLSAREIDGSIRIVVAAGMGNFGWLFPSNPDTEDAATEANRELLRKSTIADWLPAYRVVEDGNAQDAGLLFDCDRAHLPADFAGFGSIGLLTVDANNNFAITDSLGVITDGQTVYASTDRLTVAAPRYPEWDPNTGQIVEGEKLTTSLHTFDITDPASARYVASGSVEGSMLNQYSVSEHNGFLRVATTRQVGSDWEDTESSIVVLDEQDGALVPTGRVDGLGKGERIFAVRYQGDTAYVVTFRQIDPLYVIDLSDPANPVTRGELKIPGFSNYLHPVGDGLVMGVGQDATDEGRTTGAQVSLFDVSDPTNPTRVDTLALGSENSNSIVSWDARAFTWFDETAIIPVESWNWNELDDGENDGESHTAAAVLVKVEDGRLVETGRATHEAVEQCETPEGIIYPNRVDDGDAEAIFTDDVLVPEESYCWSHAPSIQRTVVANGNLYTIAYEGLNTWDFDTLTDKGWLPFR